MTFKFDFIGIIFAHMHVLLTFILPSFIRFTETCCSHWTKDQQGKDHTVSVSFIEYLSVNMNVYHILHNHGGAYAYFFTERQHCFSTLSISISNKKINKTEIRLNHNLSLKTYRLKGTRCKEQFWGDAAEKFCVLNVSLCVWTAVHLHSKVEFPSLAKI